MISGHKNGKGYAKCFPKCLPRNNKIINAIKET